MFFPFIHCFSGKNSLKNGRKSVFLVQTLSEPKKHSKNGINTLRRDFSDFHEPERAKSSSRGEGTRLEPANLALTLDVDQAPRDRAKDDGRNYSCLFGRHLFPQHLFLQFPVHAASKAFRLEFRQLYAAFVAAFREAAEKLKRGDRAAPFPQGSFPPALPFVGG